MHENHLTYFKVENFKRFESFEMENIGQFNLITGDNNVGKTSVLEALLFDEDFDFFAKKLNTVLLNKFHNIDIKKHCFSYFINKNIFLPEVKFIFEDYMAIDSYQIIIKITTDSEDTYEVSRELHPKNVDSQHLGTSEEFRQVSGIVRIPLIYFSNGYENELTELYSKYIQSDRQRKQSLLSALKTILPNIEFIEISTSVAEQPTLVITQSHVNAVMPLATFGDGVIKLFRILIDVVVNSGKRLMIDEIDAGIHHDRFPDFWRTILKACKENDVQLFATTHNWECLEFFKNVLEEPEMADYQKDARHFEIKALRNGKIKAYHYDFGQFKFAIENNHEIRGGR